MGYEGRAKDDEVDRVVEREWSGKASRDVPMFRHYYIETNEMFELASSCSDIVLT